MAKKSSITPQRSIENNGDNYSFSYHIVWLDKNLETFSNKRNLKLLSELDQDIRSFRCEDECIDYIRQKNDRNTFSYIIFITSGAFSEQIIPKIHDCICIFTLFIFCANVDNYQHLKYRKLRAICDDIHTLINRIEISIQRANNRIDFSLFHDQHSTHSNTISTEENTQTQCSIRNLKEDQACFLWFYHCHNFMINLENNDNKRAKQELITCYCQEYQDRLALSIIDDFSSESIDDNARNAITWYTSNAFIYRCTNKVLRKENISQVYSYRYIIKLLCRQLKDQHRLFIQKYKTVNKQISLHVYRGQHLDLTDILFLNNNINNLISLNGFVSTTRDKNVAMEFLKHHFHKDSVPVLIEIDINMTNDHSVVFADISEISKYPEEQEVLFSIGAVFRVKSVNFDEQQRLYIVHLSLDQHDQLNVNKYIEQTYGKHVDSDERSVLFGKLLCDMGEYESAIKYFLNTLDHLSDIDNQIRATYLNNIGVCYNEIKRQDEALKYYKAAFKIYEQTNNERGLSACQHNIAGIYHAQGDHGKAIRWALDAFDFRQKDKLEKASTLNLLGCIRLALPELEAAQNNFQEALKLRLKYLGKVNPYHPDIGISYQNLGKVDSKRYSYIDAEANYLQAAKIFRHNYPQSHPLVIEINKCLKETHRQLKY